MSWRVLYIFVEGEDDYRFFDKILRVYLKQNYDKIKIIKYAQQTPRQINKQIQAIKAQKGSVITDYLFICDINKSPCITAKKDKIKQKYPAIAEDDNKIVVVIKEIESWYLAGANIRKLGLKSNKAISQSTDNVTKEDFNRIIPNNATHLEFLLTILEDFNVKIARRRNKSFNYFFKKHISK